MICLDVMNRNPEEWVGIVVQQIKSLSATPASDRSTGSSPCCCTSCPHLMYVRKPVEVGPSAWAPAIHETQMEPQETWMEFQIPGFSLAQF